MIDLLRDAVEAAVLLNILEMQKRGGVSDWQVAQARDQADVIGSEGDTILYRVPEKTAKNFTILCECLTVLAFLPGGINFAGLHFEGKPVYGEACA